MPVQKFTYQLPLQRIIFGVDTFASLDGEAERLGINNGLVVSSPGRLGLAERAAELLGGRCVGVADVATADIPDTAFEAAKIAVEDSAADGLIVVGGGSAIGLGKALAFNLSLPFIAVVTTYSGSEISPSWKIGSGAARRGGRDVTALPATVLYDPALTVDLPVAFSAASGMNAMAHAVESLYGAAANPVTNLLSGEAIRVLGFSLPRVHENPKDLDARSDALYGAWLAAAFRGGQAISHRIAQTVRVMFNFSHAECHGAVLPFAVGYNRRAAPEAMETICQALACDAAATGLYDLNVNLGLKSGFRELGMEPSDLDKAAEAVMAGKFFNPRNPSETDVRALIEKIFHGQRPAR